MESNSDHEDKTTFEEIKSKLSSRGVHFSITHHAPVRTSQEAADIRGVSLASGAKAMLLKITAKDVLFVLSVMSAASKLSWKKTRTFLGSKKIAMASEDEVRQLTKCLPGAVPPFGSVMGLRTILDKSLVEQGETINFNCGLRTASMSMKTNDYLQFENPELVEITE